MNLDQRKLIALALLLGSDYTLGVDGIGSKRAMKLMQSAVDLHGKYGSNDWIESICHWSSFENGTELISELFRKKIQKHKQMKLSVIEKFILKINETYAGMKDRNFLDNVINAYLDPEFSVEDQQKLLSNNWIHWRSPNLMKLRNFAENKLKLEMKQIEIYLKLSMCMNMSANHLLLKKTWIGYLSAIAYISKCISSAIPNISYFENANKE